MRFAPRSQPLKIAWLLGLLLLGVRSITAQTAAPPAPAAPPWPEITRVTKPWSRWWWPGSAVAKPDLTSEMEAYTKAGLGGLEITPIYGVAGYEDKFIPYLSGNWVNMLGYTLREAKRLDLGIDMATGTGWPFGGGPLVDNDIACKELFYKTYTVASGQSLAEPVRFIQTPLVRAVGNQLYEVSDQFKLAAPATPDAPPSQAAPAIPGGSQVTIEQLVEPVFANKNLQALALDQVRFEKPLSLVSLMAYSGAGQVLDLTAKVNAQGQLDWTAPAGGNWTLYALFQGPHGKMVERAAPGAEGNVIDHFSSAALQRYLSRFDQAFAGQEVSGVRAFFNDSYEVDDSQGQATWTPGFLDEFKRRRGYDLREHLPALFGQDTAEANARVLSDYRETVSDLLLDNFTTPWRNWAASHNAIIRNQAHGSPASLLDLYAASDIPETEGTSIIRAKFATSAAHVAGHSLVSSESATWLDEHFQSTLSGVRTVVDRFFLAGVNHVFYHGTCYSPQDAPWPGWLFYASVEFNPRNSFWTDFGALNHYIARVQSFLQRGRPENDILLYYPLYDFYAQPAADGLLQHFGGGGRQGSADFNTLAESLQQQGYAFDYISDRQLQKVSFMFRTLSTGGAAYRIILVPNCQYMPVETLGHLIALAQRGATVVFLNQLPADVPGLGKLADRRQELQQLHALANFAPASQTGVQQARFGNGRFLLGSNLEALLTAANVERETLVDTGLQYVRRTTPRGRVYFLANASGKPVNGWIPLQDDDHAAALYDPMRDRSGLAQSHATATGNLEVYLQLLPGETCVVETFANAVSYAPYAYYQPVGTPQPLNGEWDLSFTTGGPALPASAKISTLASWTDLAGDQYKIFSGTARYAFSFAKPATGAAAWTLDLGQVCNSARVRLNGQDLGTVIGPNYRVTFDASLLRDQNQLEILVSNSMANRVADLDRRKVPWKRFYNVNFPAHTAQNRGPDGLFTAANWAPAPSGLLGPVTLTPLSTMTFGSGTSLAYLTTRLNR